MLMVNQLIGFAAGDAGGFVTLGADFDGSNDYMTRGADLTGAADGRKFLASFWILPGTLPTAVQRVFVSDANSNVTIYFDATKHLAAQFYNAAQTNLLRFVATAAFSEDSAWHHVLISADTNAGAGAKRMQVYVDGSAVAGATTDADAAFDIDYTSTNYGIGANVDGSNKLDSGLAELYVNFVADVDISVEASRLLFRSAAGKPVDLGADGSTPTGSAPIVYQSIRSGGAAADLATNRGGGGNFTITGTLTLTASNPSD